MPIKEFYLDQVLKELELNQDEVSESDYRSLVNFCIIYNLNIFHHCWLIGVIDLVTSFNTYSSSVWDLRVILNSSLTFSDHI